MVQNKIQSKPARD